MVDHPEKMEKRVGVGFLALGVFTTDEKEWQGSNCEVVRF